MPSVPATRYQLSDLRLEAIESYIVRALRDGGEDRSMACAIVDGSSSLAAYGRTFEGLRFPKYDMAAAMEPYEELSLFLYTADLDAGRIVHVKRLVRSRTPADIARLGSTGIEVIDDRLTASDPDERASLGDILAYHGIDPSSPICNLATNFTTDNLAPTRARPYSLLSYKAVFQYLVGAGTNDLFAYVNPMAIRSLGKLGVPSELVLGREFHLPDADGYDLDYVAIHIRSSAETSMAFNEPNPRHPLSRIVAGVSLPIVILVDDPAEFIDLRDHPGAAADAGEHPSGTTGGSGTERP